MTQPNSVIEPIERSWKELTALVESLGPGGLTLVGSDGWAVKDHLVHIAAWEHSLIALFDGKHRASAMGVVSDSGGTDAINAAVWALHRDKTPEQALDYFHQTHSQLMNRLNAMSDADLNRSYNYYQRENPRDPTDDRPALDWVAGNTYDHYAEHIAWIGQMVKDSSAAS